MVQTGFLHNRALHKLAAIHSEDTAEYKYAVESTSNINPAEENAAEFSIIDFDPTQDLEVHSTSPNTYYGMRVRNINGGPLIDKHSNYRYPVDVPDFALGTARFALVDYVNDCIDNKAKDEYWSFYNHSVISSLSSDRVKHSGHSDGEVLMCSFYKYAGNFYEIYVSVYNESTETWGAYILIDTIPRFLISAINIDCSPTFLTVPNLGTLLLYYSISQDAYGSLDYSAQNVTMAITKNHGQTWEKFGSFTLDPYHGKVVPSDVLLEWGCTVLKAIYHNNKIILGTMLQGTDSPGAPADDELRSQRILNIVYSNDLGKSWTTVPFEFVSASTLGGIPATSYNYGDSNNSGPANFGLGVEPQSDKVVVVLRSTGDEEIIENTEKIFFFYNIDDDLGQWGASTVGSRNYRLIDDFSENSLETRASGSLIAVTKSNLNDGDYFILNDGVNIATEFYFDVSGTYTPPSGVEIDISATATAQDVSDTIVSVVNGVGTLDITAINYGGTSTRVLFIADNYGSAANNKIIEYTNSTLNVDGMSGGITYPVLKYLIEDIDIGSTVTDTPSNWHVSGGYLVQDSYINDPSRAGGAGGTQLIYREHDDPTLNRTVGLHVDVKYFFDVFHTVGSGVFGLGFCRQDEDSYYTVEIDTTNIAYGICDMNIYLINGAIGTRTAISSSAQIPFNYISGDGAIDVIFEGDDTIRVFFNGDLICTATDNILRTGRIFLFCNGMAPIRFDNWGLLTNIERKNVIGTGADDGFSNIFPMVGSNIELVVDQYNQAWIAADIKSTHWGSTQFNSFGVAFNKFVLERDVERVEGKFLAKDTYSVKFHNSKYFNDDCGYYFSPHEFGLYPTHYDTTPTTRVFMEAFLWHKEEPVFYIRSGTDSSGTEELFLVQRAIYSTRTISPNFGSVYSAVPWTSDPEYSGWYLNGTYTDVDGWFIRTQQSTGWIEQSYVFDTDTFSTDGNRAMPVRYWDFYHRGFVFLMSTRSYSANSVNATRTICEFTVPRIIQGAASPEECKLRIVSTDESGVGNEDGSYDLQHYVGGTTWTSLDTLNNIDPKGGATGVFWDIMVFLVPSMMTSDSYPHVSAYARLSGSAEWSVIAEDETVSTYTVASIVADVRAGSIGGSGAINQQEIKFLGYTDTCFVDPAINPVRGESLFSGERVKATHGIVYTVGGGFSSKGDEWHITDLERSDYPASNVFDRKSVLWESDGDNTDKEVIIDADHDVEFNSIVLTGVNTRYIAVQSNDTDNFTTPNFSVEIDLAKYTDVPIDKIVNQDDMVRLYTVGTGFRRDELRDQLFITENSSHGCFRIRANSGRYLFYETDTAASIPVGNWYIHILSDSVALKLVKRHKDRYFRIICRKSGYTYPTPEGYFKIGQFSVGMFDDLQENPERNRDVTYQNHTKTVKSLGGSTRMLRQGPVSRNRRVLFSAISTNKRAFAEQLRRIVEHCDGRYPLFFVDDIEEYQLTSYGTYSLNVFPCYIDKDISMPQNPGNITNITLQLKEDI